MSEYKDIEPIDWNRIEDDKDKEIWDRLTSQFWLPEKIALSNDISSWNTLTDDEKDVVMKVFAGLTNLDTIQGAVGATEIAKFALTPHEEAVMMNIAFMEAFAEGTDFLTPDGWKDVSEVEPGDLVAQYLPSTGELEFVEPIDFYTHIAPEVVALSAGGNDAKQVVSSGHRVYVESGPSGRTFEAGDFDKQKFGLEDSFITTGVFKNRGIEFTGLDDVNARMFALTADNPVGATVTTPRGDVTVTEPFYVSLADVDGLWCRNFISAFVSSSPSVPFVDSEKKADYVAAVAALAGATAKVDKNGDVWDIVVDVDNRVPAMFVSSETRKSQQVWCVQVPSTFLLTRRDGRTVVSGNCVHAKSYSSIFMTLSNTRDIDDAMRWVRENDYMKEKRRIILEEYATDNPLRTRAMSVILESFLFYSGFFYPLYLSSHSKLTNTADIIHLIVRDESVHGYYIGYKYQKEFDKLTPEQQEIEKEWVYSALFDLYQVEQKYTQEIYDKIGLTENVKAFLEYNANKALVNLGFETLFDHDPVDPAVMTSLDTSSGENHDFFSGSGSTYLIGKAESTVDDDWGF